MKPLKKCPLPSISVLGNQSVPQTEFFVGYWELPTVLKFPGFVSKPRWGWYTLLNPAARAIAASSQHKLTVNKIY